MTENTPEMPAVARREKRVVFQHRVGRYKGLHQIMGTTAQFGGQQPPAVSGPFVASPDTRPALAELVKETPNFVLYTEVMPPEGLGTFDRAQR